MVWDIWSVGDYRFLAEVLNSVSAWAGTGSPARLASIGMLLSFIVLGFQGVLSGGKMPQFQNVLLGWIFYAFLFGPGVTVVVKDTYSLGTRVVDNVPIGIAATGSILSNLTHSITDEIKQAFSLPTMMDDVFGAALKILVDSRNIAFPPVEGGNYDQTLLNYMTDCTNVGIVRGEKSIKSTLNSTADPLEAIRFDSNIYTTKLALPGNSAVKTCTEAFNDINAEFNGAGFWGDWADLLESKYGLQNPVSDLDSVLNIMADDAYAAKKFMLSSVTYELFKLSQEQGGIASGDPALAAAITEALSQRDVQNAADAAMFKKIARPGMAFFEATTYTVAPFMALLVVLVPMGIGLVMKYFMLNIWIQLWMPSLAILNYMGNFILQGKIAVLKNVGPITSMSQVQEVFRITQDWMSTINSLAAMVPLFTMFLVTGSWMVGSAFASRMTGSDHFDEKKMNPDLLKNQPVMTAGMGSHTQDGVGKLSQDGAPTVSWKLGTSVSDTVQSASTAMEQKQTEFFNAFGEQARNSASFRNGSLTSETLGRNIAASGSETAAGIRNKVEQLSKDYNLTEAQRDGLQTVLSAQVGGKLLGTGITGNTQSVADFAKTNNISEAGKFTRDAAFSEAERADLTRRVAHDVSNGKTQEWGVGEDWSKSTDVGRKAAEVERAAETYTKASQIQQQVGSDVATTAADAGHLAHRDGLSGRVLDIAKKHGVYEQAEWLSANVYDKHHGKQDSNLAKGAFHALYNKAMNGDAAARNDLNELTMKLYNAQIPQVDGNAHRNESVAGNATNMPELKETTGSTLQGRAQTEVNKQQEGQEAVLNAHAGNKAKVEANSSAHQAAIAGERLKMAEDAAMNMWANPNNARMAQDHARTYVEGMAAVVGRGFELMGAASKGAGGHALEQAKAGFNAHVEEFNRHMEENPENAQGWLAKFKEGMATLNGVAYGARLGAAAVLGITPGASEAAGDAVQASMAEAKQEWIAKGESMGLSRTGAELYAETRERMLNGEEFFDTVTREDRGREAFGSKYDSLRDSEFQMIRAGAISNNDAYLAQAAEIADTKGQVAAYSEQSPSSSPAAGSEANQIQAGPPYAWQQPPLGNSSPRGGGPEQFSNGEEKNGGTNKRMEEMQKKAQGMQ